MLRACKRRWAVSVLALGIGSGCGRPPSSPVEAPATVFLLASAAPRAPAEPLDEGPAPTLPPRPQSEWQELSGNGPLREAIEQRARRAMDRGLLPVLFVGQRSCEPCEAVKHYREDPRMQQALRGTSILEVDLSRWGAVQLMELGMAPHAIPAFFVLDARGRSTGEIITGGAWGEDIPENMAPPLREFFARAHP